jgi:hypothetical protein
MVRSIALLGAAWLALSGGSAVLEAQGSPPRRGLSVHAGLGMGSFGGEGIGARESGLAGELELGWTLTPQVLVGVEGGAWTKKEGDTRLTHASVLAVGRFYPMVERGLFVRGGVGFANLRVASSAPNLSYRVGDSALAVGAGLGYDIRVGSSISITPYAAFVLGDFEGGSANVFQGGLGVTWH